MRPTLFIEQAYPQGRAYNPATYPVVKQISLFRITNPHSTEGGMTYPADHAANFANLFCISVWTGDPTNHAVNFTHLYRTFVPNDKIYHKFLSL